MFYLTFRCQDELEKDYNAQEMKLRKRSVGAIRFIGELYKIEMIKGASNNNFYYLY